jgi:hypothetical protein
MGQIMLAPASIIWLWPFANSQEKRPMRWALRVATAANVALTVLCCWVRFQRGLAARLESSGQLIVHYMVATDRRFGTLTTFTVPDALQLLPLTIVAAVTQLFFGYRSYIVTGRSKVFAVFAATFILLAFVSGITLVVLSLLTSKEVTGLWNQAIFLVVQQVFLWSPVIVNLSCSAALIYQFRKLKQNSHYNLAWVFDWLHFPRITLKGLMTHLAE